MRNHHIFTILTLIPLIAVLMLVQPALAQATGSIVGSVFVDANGNSRAEPGEALVSDATVYLRSQANPNVVFTVLTDANGYFLAHNVPYDLYYVWATAPDQSGFHLLAAEVSEVNAQVLIDVPVSEEGAAPAQGKTLFLPLLFSGA